MAGDLTTEQEVAIRRDRRKCTCKGTGLIGSGRNKAYCSRHPIDRVWPRHAEGGGMEFINLRTGKVEKA